MQYVLKNQRGTRSRTTGILMRLALVVAISPCAWAQLTAADLEALRAQGEREGWTFTVGENEATQYSLKELCGVVEPPDWREHARFDDCATTRDLPASFDWRTQGVLGAVRNQGSCGSCWAFSIIGAVEPQIAIQDQVLVDLSEQWLVSCCGLGGCSGDWPGTAARYLRCNGQYTDYCGGFGAVPEASFPYQGWDAPCNCPYPHTYCLDSYTYVGPQWGIPTVNQIKQAILDHGPVSVCVDATSAFQGYNGGIFNSCSGTSINHAVVLVGWDDNQGTDGVWFLRNSWGAGWGEQGYMRIAYNCSMVGYGALYVTYAGLPPSLTFTYPDGKPTEAPAQQAVTFHVDVAGKYDGVPVANSGQLHYSINDAPFVMVPMTEESANHYSATLPAVGCMDRVRWYVSAAEATSGRIYDPLTAPAGYNTTLAISYRAALLADDFETDRGWTVSNTALIAGAWERGVPVGLGERGDPASDYDGSGACFLTGNFYGDSDVDGGPTRLISPVFDLSDGRFYQVAYARWFYNDDNDIDRLTVDVSNNNGVSWVNVETVPHTVGWVHRTFNVSDYVTPTAQVKVRFCAVDTPSNSITEAGLDAFSVSALICPAVGDVNCDGVVDFRDINPFVLALTNPATYATLYAGCPELTRDINGDGVLSFADINPFVNLLAR